MSSCEWTIILYNYKRNFVNKLVYKKVVIAEVFKKLIKDERGSSVILELAVILIIMIMLFYGFTMYTNALSIKLVLRTAAREGAREYSTSHDVSKAIKRAETELELSGMGDAEIRHFTDGKGMRVEVIKHYPFYIPFAGTQDLRMKGSAIFVEEPMPKSRN